MRIQSMATGIFSCLPGGNKFLFDKYNKVKDLSGTLNARYCYSVWLRHLVRCFENGGITEIPNVVAEIGPGNSLGTGIAALLSGAHRYYALDYVRHIDDTSSNIRILDELLLLFKNRTDIPDNKEFPEIITELSTYKFPVKILNDRILSTALSPNRIESIRRNLLKIGMKNEGQSYVSYHTPWNDHSIIRSNSVDMIFSMSVFEHIDDLQTAYNAANKWIKKGGILSNEIDFTCHGHSKAWNGHWTYSDTTWKIMRGCRPYFINREPHTTHLELLNNNGFKVIIDNRKKNYNGVKRKDLVSRFIDISNLDLATYNSFIMSRKID